MPVHAPFVFPEGWFATLLPIFHFKPYILARLAPQSSLTGPSAGYLFWLRTSIRHLNCMTRVRRFVGMFSEIRFSFLSAEEARRVVPDPIRETFSKRPVTTFSEDHRQKCSTVIGHRSDLLALRFGALCRPDRP
jgi:hypothetical protein